MVSATIDFSPTGGTQEIDQHQPFSLDRVLEMDPQFMDTEGGAGTRGAGWMGWTSEVLEF